MPNRLLLITPYILFFIGAIEKLNLFLSSCSFIVSVIVGIIAAVYYLKKTQNLNKKKWKRF